MMPIRSEYVQWDPVGAYSIDQFKTLTVDGFLEIIADFDVQKSSGIKGMSSNLLIDAMKAIPTVFIKIINMSLNSGKFPDDMKLARIAVIPKKR